MPSRLSPRILLAVAAAAGPSLLAYNVPPSPTVLNQALALALWGGFVVACRPQSMGGGRGVQALYLALLLLLAAAALSWGPGSLPTGLALSAIGLIVAAGVMAASGAAAPAQPDAPALFGDYCVGFAVAGALNVVIAMVQVFVPGWTVGDLVAVSTLPGRAVGNLRQPNHLSSVLLWAAVAVVALAELGRLGRRAAAALFAAIVFAVVLSASRTGVVGVLLLAAWGLVDRRLARGTRGLLLAAPVLYGLAWLGMAGWAQLAQHPFGGEARLAASDISGSRFGIWRNAWGLVAQQPWSGVGFGEFNLAWTLTPFPDRPVAFFDHAHNLPLQLLVELGVPLAVLVMAALVAALWMAARCASRATGEIGVARRAALMMVTMIALHSLLEYPLWYAFFLLPAAWALAFAAGETTRQGVQRRTHALVGGGVALVAAAAFAVVDYLPVAAVFEQGNVSSFPQRVGRGQDSLLFAHHAD